MIGNPLRPRLTRSRRVNPRISLFASCQTTTYYSDDEIPETRVTTRAACERAPIANVAGRGRLVRSKLCDRHVFLNSLRESSDEDDFIVLTAHKPVVKEAHVLSQSMHQNFASQGRETPKLPKFHLYKYYCATNRQERGDVESESESSLSPCFPYSSNDIDSQNTFSGSSTDSSPEASDRDLDNDRRRQRLSFRFSSFSRRKSVGVKGSVSIDETTPTFLSGDLVLHGLRRKSLSVCGSSPFPRKIPRKQSKAIKMLCASEGFVIPRMSRPSLHFECEEFATRTRRFSTDQIRNVLFIPRGEIRIYRLTHEKFLNVNEIINAL